MMSLLSDVIEKVMLRLAVSKRLISEQPYLMIVSACPVDYFSAFMVSIIWLDFVFISWT